MLEWSSDLYGEREPEQAVDNLNVIVFLYRICQETPEEHDAYSEASKNSASQGLAEHVKSGVLHIISLAHFSITHARGWAAKSVSASVRIAAEKDRLHQEIALLREELRIKDARMSVIAPHRRPRYAPTERLAILEIRAARGWSLKQTADACSSPAIFGVNSTWIKLLII